MRGFAAVGLDNPKTPSNIAGVLRACGCYGVSLCAITGKRYQRHGADTKKQWREMPLLHVEDLHTVIPYDCVPIAVELSPFAQSIVDFVHPRRAFYIFGAEDNTLGERILSWCHDVIMIPTVSCMNLAACVNVVLYDRMQKQLREV